MSDERVVNAYAHTHPHIRFHPHPHPPHHQRNTNLHANLYPWSLDDDYIVIVFSSKVCVQCSPLSPSRKYNNIIIVITANGDDIIRRRNFRRPSLAPAHPSSRRPPEFMAQVWPAGAPKCPRTAINSMNNDRLVGYNIVFTRAAGARHPVHPVLDDIYICIAQYIHPPYPMRVRRDRSVGFRD